MTSDQPSGYLVESRIAMLGLLARRARDTSGWKRVVINALCLILSVVGLVLIGAQVHAILQSGH